MNLRPPVYKTGALPTELLKRKVSGHNSIPYIIFFDFDFLLIDLVLFSILYAKPIHKKCNAVTQDTVNNANKNSTPFITTPAGDNSLPGPLK